MSQLLARHPLARRLSGSLFRHCAPALAATALLLSWPPTAQADSCLPECISSSSVMNAAGVPPKVKAAAKRLRFDGNQLAKGDAAVVADMARAIKSLPARAVLSLGVAADPGLSPAASSQQAAARAKALHKALLAAGVPAAKVKVSAAG